MSKVPGELNVTGEGSVQVKPDIAWVRLGVLTEAKNAADAVAQNADRINQIVTKILSFGIPRTALRTTGLSIAPVYDPAGSTPQVIGYRVDDALTIECVVELAAKVFDGGVAAGANQSSGVSFGLRDPAPHRHRALEAAVAAARADAETVAGAMGLALVGPRLVDIDAAGSQVTITTARAERPGTPVLAGELTVSARVRVVFSY